MSFMFEVYYRPPANPDKEAQLTARVATFGGRLSYREDAGGQGNASVCLTYEFGDRSKAESAAEALRANGEHVEGPVDYGAPR